MAQLGFVRRQGLRLRRLDSRCRFFSFVLLSLAVFFVGTAGSIALAAALVLLLLAAGTQASGILADIRPLVPLLVLIVAFRAFMPAADAQPLFSGFAAATPGAPTLLGSLTFSPGGLVDGVLFSLRLVNAALLTGLFLSVTSVSDIRNVMARACRRVPFLAVLDLDLLIALVFSFMPLIREESVRIRMAQNARCIGGRGLLYRMQAFTLVLLGSLIRSSGRTALALESRAYNRERTLPDCSWRPADTVALALSAAVLAAALLFR